MHTSPRPLLLVGALLAELALGCHRSGQKAATDSISQPGPSVKLSCPSEASSQGPIAFDVVLDADARTYWNTQGILDDALEILLIRRDKPGLMTVSKVSPEAAMYPPTPLAGRPSDDELVRSRERITQQHQYDLLAYGRKHEGSAEYFVLATFAGAWDGPYPLTVLDQRGPRSSDEPSDGLPAAAPAGEHVPPNPGLTVELRALDGRPTIVGAFRLAQNPSKAITFLSMVLSPLGAAGRPFAKQFRLSPYQQDDQEVGTFAVPLARLASPVSPTRGRHVLFVSLADKAVTRIVDLP